MFEVEECCHEMEDSIVFQIAGKVRNKALTSLKEHGVRITSICGDVQVAWTTDHDTNHIFRCWTDGILIFWMLFDGDSYTIIWQWYEKDMMTIEELLPLGQIQKKTLPVLTPQNKNRGQPT